MPICMSRQAFAQAKVSATLLRIVNKTMGSSRLRRELRRKVILQVKGKIDGFVVQLFAYGKGVLVDSILHLCHCKSILRESFCTGIVENSPNTAGRTTNIYVALPIVRQVVGNRGCQQCTGSLVNLHLIPAIDRQNRERRISIVIPKEIGSNVPISRIVDEVLQKVIKLFQFHRTLVAAQTLRRLNCCRA